MPLSAEQRFILVLNALNASTKNDLTQNLDIEREKEMKVFLDNIIDLDSNKTNPKSIFDMSPLVSPKPKF